MPIWQNFRLFISKCCASHEMMQHTWTKASDQGSWKQSQLILPNKASKTRTLLTYNRKITCKIHRAAAIEKKCTNFGERYISHLKWMQARDKTAPANANKLLIIPSTELPSTLSKLRTPYLGHHTNPPSPKLPKH